MKVHIKNIQICRVVVTAANQEDRLVVTMVKANKLQEAMANNNKLQEVTANNNNPMREPMVNKQLEPMANKQLEPTVNNQVVMINSSNSKCNNNKHIPKHMVRRQVVNNKVITLINNNNNNTNKTHMVVANNKTMEANRNSKVLKECSSKVWVKVSILGVLHHR